MKAGERTRVTALRLVLSELQKAAKEGDADELAVLRRERKRRREAQEAYTAAGGEDLAGRQRGPGGRRGVRGAGHRGLPPGGALGRRPGRARGGRGGGDGRGVPARH